jgi:hypothetical protein
MILSIKVEKKMKHCCWRIPINVIYIPCSHFEILNKLHERALMHLNVPHVHSLSGCAFCMWTCHINFMPEFHDKFYYTVQDTSTVLILVDDYVMFQIDFFCIVHDKNVQMKLKTINRFQSYHSVKYISVVLDLYWNWYAKTRTMYHFDKTF